MNTDAHPTALEFQGIDPVAKKGLAGLVRDSFCHGRTFATVGAHGGLLTLSHFADQHLGGALFFKGDGESAWVKMFRVRVRIGADDYYLLLNDTKLMPFGYSSHCEINGVEFTHELLLLPDALVQRARVISNPQNLPIQFEMVHQEEVTAVTGGGRTWADFAFDADRNGLIVSCSDINEQVVFGHPEREVRIATTWIGVSADVPLDVRRGYNPRSKYYITGKPISGSDAAFFIAFARDENQLYTRLAELSKTVHAECDNLLEEYDSRLKTRPRIDVGDPVLNSAFGQYPEVIHTAKIPDKPGAVRASISGYFVWGWDGMTPLIPLALANEPEYVAQMFRFFKETIIPEWGIPMTFTTAFNMTNKAPFPAMCQYIASLYHYVSTTGDLAVAEEMFDTCKYLLDRCKIDEVGSTGLVRAMALWPDFPMAMGETGDDISSLNNSLLYQGLRSMEYLAHALGHADLAQSYGDWARRLRINFVKYLYDEDQGYFISSCSSLEFSPRKHYCCQAIFWITPFARELTSHAPDRISWFMDKHLRSDKCLLSLPHWDTAWMADGNQLGSSYPTADYFYLNVHKIVGNDFGLTEWLSDVEWFWRFHTAPEAFTPEAENEAALGPDNPGGKQIQAMTCWYACVYTGLAGMDFDHEGITFTPWGDKAVSIGGLKLHDTLVNIEIGGKGNHIGSLKLNGEELPAGSRKIAWSNFRGPSAKIELMRSETVPGHPVIVRADGLRLANVETSPNRISVRVDSDISGEVIIEAASNMHVNVDGQRVESKYDPATKTFCVPYTGTGILDIFVSN